MPADTLNEEEMTLLAGAHETPVGRAVLHAAWIMEQRAERAMADPKLNTERVADDFRFVLGERRGVGWVNRLIGAARRQRGFAEDDDNGAR